MFYLNHDTACLRNSKALRLLWGKVAIHSTLARQLHSSLIWFCSSAFLWRDSSTQLCLTLLRQLQGYRKTDSSMKTESVLSKPEQSWFIILRRPCPLSLIFLSSYKWRLQTLTVWLVQKAQPWLVKTEPLWLITEDANEDTAVHLQLDREGLMRPYWLRCDSRNSSTRVD